MRLLLGFLLLFVAVYTAHAAEVVPDSYVAPAGDQGWLTAYLDASGKELTDGVYSGPWPAEPGYPDVYTYDYGPWYGWDGRWHEEALSITFDFASAVQLSAISISTGRETPGAVYIPQRIEAYRWTGSDWTQIADRSYDDATFVDRTRHTLSIPVTAVTDKIKLVMTPVDDRWIILDEVDFTGEPVPEPSSLLALLTGIGGLGGVVRFRTKKS